MQFQKRSSGWNSLNDAKANAQIGRPLVEVAIHSSASLNVFPMTLLKLKKKKKDDDAHCIAEISSGKLGFVNRTMQLFSIVCITTKAVLLSCNEQLNVPLQSCNALKDEGVDF